MLDEEEMRALLHTDPPGGPRMRMLIASLRTRLNITTGCLALTTNDCEQIQHCSRHQGAENLLMAALAKHLADG